MSHCKGRQSKIAITRLAAVVIIVAILAIVAAVGVAEYGMHGMGRGPASTTLTTSSSVTSSASSSVQSSVQTSVASSVTSSVTSSHVSSTFTTGILSVLISDPPHVPSNVSALYITYPSMFVHIQGVQGQDGWIQVSSSGSIQLLGAVNIGQTVASANVPAGTYDMIRFEVSSAIVTYDSHNYTAIVQDGNLTIHFTGPLTANPSQASALVVDMQPFVYNFGNSSNPSFVLKMGAISFPAPSGSVSSQMQNVGNRFQFQAGNTWFWQYRNNNYPNVNISNIRLTGSSLSATISDQGSQDVTINAITVTPLQQTASGGNGHGSGSGNGNGYGNGNSVNASTPDGLSGSAVFLVLPGGSLSPISRTQTGTPLNISSQIWGGQGYALRMGASVSLSYSGTIQLGLKMSSNTQPGNIVPGQQYLVSIVGDDSCANYVVTAS